MMNTWTHAIATLFLAFMAFSIHIMIRNQATVNSLDTTRLYSMVRFRGDVDAAKGLLSSDSTWLTEACRSSVSLALPTTNACVEERRRLRNGILQAMGCFSYSSQVCSYLRNITAGIIQNKTVSGTLSAVGRDLTGAAPNTGGLTYRQLLTEAIDKAPLLFHNSFRAEQPEFVVTRTVLFTMIVFAILGNLLVHLADRQDVSSMSYRLLMRIIIFVLCVKVPALIFIILGGGGSSIVAILGIWVPATIVLLYYEAFLDHTITRPWIHPYTFCVIYTSISILALTENDVLNTMVVGLAIAQAQAVCLLYMQVVWYWSGKMEKQTHRNSGPDLTVIYQTKEMQYALYLTFVVITLLCVLQTTGPFDYNSGSLDITLRGAPCIFLVLAVFGTLYLQEMDLDDEYGKEVEKPAITDKASLVKYATRITGGKLGVSLLLIAFGVLYELNLIGEYFRGLRAYTDKIPERAWQLDSLSRYTIGTGFLPAPTLYL